MKLDRFRETRWKQARRERGAVYEASKRLGAIYSISSRSPRFSPAYTIYTEEIYVPFHISTLNFRHIILIISSRLVILRTDKARNK